MSIVAERLRKSRERKGLKQVQVYERTGINNKTLSRYENGGTEPDMEALLILANLYEVTTDYLLGRSDYPHHTATEQERLKPIVFDRLEKLYIERKLTPEDIEKINEYAEFITRDKENK